MKKSSKKKVSTSGKQSILPSFKYNVTLAVAIQLSLQILVTIFAVIGIFYFQASELSFQAIFLGIVSILLGFGLYMFRRNPKSTVLLIIAGVLSLPLGLITLLTIGLSKK